MSKPVIIARSLALLLAIGAVWIIIWSTLEVSRAPNIVVSSPSRCPSHSAWQFEAASRARAMTLRLCLDQVDALGTDAKASAKAIRLGNQCEKLADLVAQAVLEEP